MAPEVKSLKCGQSVASMSVFIDVTCCVWFAVVFQPVAFIVSIGGCHFCYFQAYAGASVTQCEVIVGHVKVHWGDCRWGLCRWGDSRRGHCRWGDCRWRDCRWGDCRWGDWSRRLPPGRLPPGKLPRGRLPPGTMEIAVGGDLGGNPITYPILFFKETDGSL